MASGESDEIEAEAHSYLHQVVSGGLPVEHVLDILIRFKESSVIREQEMFTCMVRMILAQHKDLPTYSLSKVKIIAYLYAYGTFRIALNDVFDDLVEPPETNMFIFGSKALELFVERLRELPFYRNFALTIPHFRTKCPNLVGFIESIPPLKSNVQVLAQNVDVTAETPRTGSLYVGDLDVNVADSQLHYIFSFVGQIVSARICRDPITRRSLGYGYVKYQNSHEAATAVEKFSNAKFMKVMCYQSIGRSSGSTRVFFRSSYVSIDDRALYDIFWSFGDIVSLEVQRHPSSGDSKGFGFVNFENADSAAKAVEILNGKKIGDIKLCVELARQRKVKRGAGVQAQISSQMTPSNMAHPFVYNNTPCTIMTSPSMATPLYNLHVTIGGRHLPHGRYPPPILSLFRPLPQANGYFGYQQQQQLVPGMQSGGILGMHPWGAPVPN